MSDVATLRLALLAVVTLGYAAVLGRMMVTGAIWRWPAFWSYLFVATMKSATWLYPAAMNAWTPYEPLVVGLKILAALEAFYWATRSLPSPRRWRFALGLLCATSIGIMLACLMPMEPNPARGWVRTRQIAHVGLASFAVSGCLWWWARFSRTAVEPRVRRHAVILTVYLLAYAVAGSIADHKSGTTEQERWALYYLRGAAFRVPALLCLVAWWREAKRTQA